MSANNKISYVFRDANVPQPYEKKGNNPWVIWGEANLYPQFLFGLVYSSPIHSGIINSKVTYISAGGLKYEGTDLAKWELIKRNGSSKYTLDEVASSVTFDNEVINSFYIKYTKNILTGMWEASPLDVELMRNDESGVYYYYSENWIGQQTAEKTKFKTYKNIEYGTPEDTELVLYVSAKSKQYQLDNKKLTCNVYPVPTYAGSIVSIMADVEMNSFHYTESVNSFTGGSVFKLNNGIPEDEDKKAIERDIRDGVTDKKKKGGIVILYADGKERQAEIEQVNGNNNDVRYLETQKFIADSIMIGHSVINPALFGVKTAGSLGNTNELEVSYAIFKQNYAKSRQKIISEALTYGAKKLNGLSGEISFNEYNLQLTGQVDEENKTLAKINQLSPIVANQVLATMTPNQKLALIGLPPIQGGDVLPTATPSATGFKSDDKVLTKLMSVGVSKSEIAIVSSKSINSFDDLMADEEMFMQEFAIESFAKVDTDDKTILGLIDKGVTYNNIQKEIGKRTSQKILDLEKNGYLQKNNNGKVELTDKGRTEIRQTSFKVLYTYEKRADAPDLIGSSREFCLAMLESDKAFTRSEIEQINNDEGTNVWLYRGGWYHNPETDKNQPSCRHEWRMNLVIA